MNFQLTDFDYELPVDLIAHEPAEERDASRLMTVKRGETSVEHGHFRDIERFFCAGDVLVVNNTRVIPARIAAYRSTGAAVEVFLIEQEHDMNWLVMLKPAKRLKEGELLTINDELFCRVIKKNLDEAVHRVAFEGSDLSTHRIFSIGHLPLPPYVRPTEDSVCALERHYQTVYARHQGAVAAPTAGLHFSEKLLQRLIAKGVEILEVTLHVGIGTFKPLSDQMFDQNYLHSERAIVSSEVASKLNQARLEGRRIVAVGTTVARTLESNITDEGFLGATFATSLFIKPGFSFRAIDGLITNFHLPRSSLLCLVAAFSGYNSMRFAYQSAVAARYRFYSFGDAMLIV